MEDYCGTEETSVQNVTFERKLINPYVPNLFVMSHGGLLS
jgi:hypothetical protein